MIWHDRTVRNFPKHSNGMDGLSYVGLWAAIVPRLVWTVLFMSGLVHILLNSLCRARVLIAESLSPLVSRQSSVLLRWARVRMAEHRQLVSVGLVRVVVLILDWTVV